MFNRWLQTLHVKHWDVLTIPSLQMDSLLCHFFIKARKGRDWIWARQSYLFPEKYWPPSSGTRQKLQRTFEPHIPEITRYPWGQTKGAPKGWKREKTKQTKLLAFQRQKLWSCGKKSYSAPIPRSHYLELFWFNNTMQFGWRARD